MHGPTAWDGDEGPFTMNEFIDCYGRRDAVYWWLQGALQRQYDGDEGPFAWCEFVRFYGPKEGRRRWIRARKVRRPSRPAPKAEPRSAPPKKAPMGGAELFRSVMLRGDDVPLPTPPSERRRVTPPVRAAQSGSGLAPRRPSRRARAAGTRRRRSRTPRHT